MQKRFSTFIVHKEAGTFTDIVEHLVGWSRMYNVNIILLTESCRNIQKLFKLNNASGKAEKICQCHCEIECLSNRCLDKKLGNKLDVEHH